MGLIYFRDGKVIAESGQVKVYEMDDNRYLEKCPGHNLWASSWEIRDYEEQLKDIPRGNCLEIGLGLGVVSNYILGLEQVNHLTTIELDRDVVECYTKLNKTNNIKHSVIISDVHRALPILLNSNIKYDFIFFDHYSLIDEDTIKELSELVPIAKKLLVTDGKIMGWFDPFTPEEFLEGFNRIFNYK